MFGFWENSTFCKEYNSQLKVPNQLTLSWIPLHPSKENVIDEEGWLAVGGNEERIGICFTSTNHQTNLKRSRRGSYNLPVSLTGDETPSTVKFVRFNEKTRRLAACDSNNNVSFWMESNHVWCLLNKVHIQMGIPTNMLWSKNGNVLITVCNSSPAISIIYPNQCIFQTFRLVDSTNNIYAFFSQNEQQLYVVCGGGTLATINLDPHPNMHVLQVHTQIHYVSQIIQISCSYKQTLAVCTSDRMIHLNHGIEDQIPKSITTNFTDMLVEWSNSGEYLAVLGSTHPGIIHLQIHDANGKMILKLPPLANENLPVPPLLSMTWGHSDTRLFVSTGTQLKVARIIHKMASLEEMSCNVLRRSLPEKKLAAMIIAPSSKTMLQNMMHSTIFRIVPSSLERFTEFLVTPLSEHQGQIFCTVVNCGASSILVMEHLSGGILLLKAQRISRRFQSKFIISSVRPINKEPTILGQVSSNIWGTKFKIINCTKQKKKSLGKICFQEHLAPREITILIPRNNCKTDKLCNEPNITIRNTIFRCHDAETYFIFVSGGRATIKSGKNCCFHYNNSPALQFGKTGINCYTLDFGYPFTVLQAFAFALTNIYAPH